LKPSLVDSLGKKLPVIDSANIKGVKDSVMKALPGGGKTLPSIKSLPTVVDSLKKRIEKDTTKAIRKP